MIPKSLLFRILCLAALLPSAYAGPSLARSAQDSACPSTAETAPGITIMADFYWWYPWYGLHYRGPDGERRSPRASQDKNVMQEGFTYVFRDPIPYLQSTERPSGVHQDNLAKDWFKSNFQRAAANGIAVMAVMARPDLPAWKTAIGLMVEAQKELERAGQPFPSILFHFDYVENWNLASPGTGSLSGPGPTFDSVWGGVKQTFDTVYALMPPEKVARYFFTLPGRPNTVPVFFYRVEGVAQRFTSSGWWVDELKKRFSKQYPGTQLYLVLDSYFCDAQYGKDKQIVMNSCNADNYYLWGGALRGARPARYGTGLRIVTVGPGFDERTRRGPDGRVQARRDGRYYQENLDKAVDLGVNWLLIETFNFGEEGTAIDATTGPNGFGNQYLDITKQFAASLRCKTLKGVNEGASSTPKSKSRTDSRPK